MAERWEHIERVATPAIVPQFGALSGVRVLLTGSVVAAPFAATILAEQGAEVIHVERPNVGDAYRLQSPQLMLSGDKSKPFMLAGPEVPSDKKVSAAWANEGRNKLSLALEVNMKIPESKEIFLSLIKNCDIWLENMVWTEKLGITEELVFQVNPKIIIAHVSGFGRPQFGGTPEDCDRGSYDPIGQAESGWMHLNGWPDRPPSYGGSFVSDYMTAMFAVSGIMFAYVDMLKTGKGQAIDVTQIESMSKTMCDTFVNYNTLGMVKTRAGNKLPIFQPADLFQSKDGYVYIATFGQTVYERTLRAMDISPEEFPYFEAGASREAINSELGLKLDQRVKEWALARTSEEACEHLKKHKIPCAITRTAKDLSESKHYASRDNWIEYKDETLGQTIKAFSFAPKMSRSKQQVWRGAPMLGQDTSLVLNKIAGYSDSEIAAFKSKGVIG
ncbi:MAG: CoA transferase [Desulfobulbaceae bacterium]|jgi:crotonobetainyl-CoA:carnitine CoA-transferase CaiB-like acyl-CoA transferase|nr:CoA transferase [Desulfobulbaceae bacterium]